MPFQVVRTTQLSRAIERVAGDGRGEDETGDGCCTGGAEAARDRDVGRRLQQAGCLLHTACGEAGAEGAQQDVVVGVGVDRAESTAALDAQRLIVRQVASGQPPFEREADAVEARAEVGSAARHAYGRGVQRVGGQSSSRIWSA